jgi:RNA polymerase sigma-70 factor (ECF subfamily)
MNKPAFRQIEAEIPRLRRFARYLARDIDLADDLVQECLLRAVSRIDTWEPGTNLRAWLLAILRNVFLSELRRVRRSPVHSEPDEGRLSAAQEKASATHQCEPEFVIYLASVQCAFDRLSEEHREILALVAIEDLTYEEAAAVLDIPIGTVRSRLSRARTALRELMAHKGGKTDRTISSCTNARAASHHSS